MIRFNLKFSDHATDLNPSKKAIGILHVEMLTTHTARRTFITLALEKGMRPEVVMRITGHSKLSTLQRYISITDNVLEREMRDAFG